MAVQVSVLSYLQAVSMHKHLCHRSAAYVHVFNLLRCDVLALSQLEDVLLAVDDLQNATLFARKTKIAEVVLRLGHIVFI